MTTLTRFSIIVLFLMLSGIVFGAQSNTRAEPTKAAPVRMAAPAKPANPGEITAKPGVLQSAACCLKQCSGGGFCGQKCDVVDKLSACSSNIKFECPAGKGLICVSGTCKCE